MSRSGFHNALIDQPDTSRQKAIFAAMRSYKDGETSRIDAVSELAQLGISVPVITKLLLIAKARRLIAEIDRPYGYENGRCVECHSTDGFHTADCLAIN